MYGRREKLVAENYCSNFLCSLLIKKQFPSVRHTGILGAINGSGVYSSYAMYIVKVCGVVCGVWCTAFLPHTIWRNVIGCTVYGL